MTSQDVCSRATLTFSIRRAVFSSSYYALISAGFEKPSAIQQKGIVPFGKGLDVIQQAQSGTGKTATFCAGILQNLDYNLMECQALVLAPTRELAQQIEKVMRALGDYQQVKRASSACSQPGHCRFTSLVQLHFAC